MIAVICEYDPFHNGHAFHLSQTRNAFPNEPIVCIMSGYFTQRGGPAMFSKAARTRMALECDADAVVELPLPYALSGAKDFAWGGVCAARLLGARVLSFGSECGDADALKRAAEITEDTPEFTEKLHEALESGLGFAAARAEAASVLDAEAAVLLNSPNNILGVEYCRALNGTGILPYTVRRIGTGHNESLSDTAYPSASGLRAALTTSPAAELSAYMPIRAWEILCAEIKSGRAPVTESAFDTAILAILRDMTPAEFASYADVSEGLEYRILDALRSQGSVSAACDTAKTRRYSHARIRRACWRAFLRIPRERTHTPPPYLRLLGLTSTCPPLTCAVPLLSRSREIDSMSDTAKAWFAADERACDLYALGYPDSALHIAGNERRYSPVYVKR